MAAGPSPDTATSRAMVDFHNHVIPGVDDGASDEAETRRALDAFAAEGVGRVIATPHVRLFAPGQGSVPDRLAEIDAGWTRLETCTRPDMPVRRGAELRLDTADPDLTDDRLRLGGTRFALVEYPYFTIPPRSDRVLALLVRRGWAPIVAHPERYSGFDDALDVVRQWRAAGACLQINAGSFLGRYGERARQLAFALLRQGLADYIASDYHARSAPRLADALALLVRSGAGAQVELLARTNPSRLWEDQSPVAVPPWPGPDGGDVASSVAEGP
jgi:protein-tyrosine phosphatase